MATVQQTTPYIKRLLSDSVYYVGAGTANDERALIDGDQVWLQISLIPSTPPVPSAYPGTPDINNIVSGISGVSMTLVTGTTNTFASTLGHFSLMVPASYSDYAYEPMLTDASGTLVPYDPVKWSADGINQVIEFYDTAYLATLRAPFTLTYWKYIGSTASGTSGTITGGANVGGGAGQIYSGVTGTAIDFRTLTNSDGSIDISTAGNLVTTDVVITGVSGGGSGGVNPYLSTDATNGIQIRNLVPGSGVTIAATGTNSKDITISATGSGGTITGAANVGTGAGVYRDTTGTTLNFRSFLSGNTALTVTEGTDEITHTANAINISSGGEAIYAGVSATAGEGFKFKGLIAGTGIYMSPSATDVTISTNALPPAAAIDFYIDNSTGTDSYTTAGTIGDPFRTIEFTMQMVRTRGWNTTAKVTIMGDYLAAAATISELDLNPGDVGDQQTPLIISGQLSSAQTGVSTTLADAYSAPDTTDIQAVSGTFGPLVTGMLIDYNTTYTPSTTISTPSTSYSVKSLVGNITSALTTFVTPLTSTQLSGTPSVDTFTLDSTINFTGNFNVTSGNKPIIFQDINLVFTGTDCALQFSDGHYIFRGVNANVAASCAAQMTFNSELTVGLPMLNTVYSGSATVETPTAGLNINASASSCSMLLKSTDPSTVVSNLSSQGANNVTIDLKGVLRYCNLLGAAAVTANTIQNVYIASDTGVTLLNESFNISNATFSYSTTQLVPALTIDNAIVDITGDVYVSANYDSGAALLIKNTSNVGAGSNNTVTVANASAVSTAAGTSISSASDVKLYNFTTSSFKDYGLDIDNANLVITGTATINASGAKVLNMTNGKANFSTLSSTNTGTFAYCTNIVGSEFSATSLTISGGSSTTSTFIANDSLIEANGAWSITTIAAANAVFFTDCITKFYASATIGIGAVTALTQFRLYGGSFDNDAQVTITCDASTASNVGFYMSGGNAYLNDWIKVIPTASTLTCFHITDGAILGSNSSTGQITTTAVGATNTIVVSNGAQATILVTTISSAATLFTASNSGKIIILPNAASVVLPAASNAIFYATANASITVLDNVETTSGSTYSARAEYGSMINCYYSITLSDQLQIETSSNFICLATLNCGTVYAIDLSNISVIRLISSSIINISNSTLLVSTDINCDSLIIIANGSYMKCTELTTAFQLIITHASNAFIVNFAILTRSVALAEGSSLRIDTTLTISSATLDAISVSNSFISVAGNISINAASVNTFNTGISLTNASVMYAGAAVSIGNGTGEILVNAISITEGSSFHIESTLATYSSGTTSSTQSCVKVSNSTLTIGTTVGINTKTDGFCNYGMECNNGGTIVIGSTLTMSSLNLLSGFIYCGNSSTISVVGNTTLTTNTTGYVGTTTTTINLITADKASTINFNGTLDCTYSMVPSGFTTLIIIYVLCSNQSCINSTSTYKPIYDSTAVCNSNTDYLVRCFNDSEVNCAAIELQSGVAAPVLTAGVVLGVCYADTNSTIECTIISYTTGTKYATYTTPITISNNSTFNVVGNITLYAATTAHFMLTSANSNINITGNATMTVVEGSVSDRSIVLAAIISLNSSTVLINGNLTIEGTAQSGPLYAGVVSRGILLDSSVCTIIGTSNISHTYTESINLTNNSTLTMNNTLSLTLYCLSNVTYTNATDYINCTNSIINVVGAVTMQGDSTQDLAIDGIVLSNSTLNNASTLTIQQVLSSAINLTNAANLTSIGAISNTQSLTSSGTVSKNCIIITSQSDLKCGGGLTCSYTDNGIGTVAVTINLITVTSKSGMWIGGTVNTTVTSGASGIIDAGYLALVDGASSMECDAFTVTTVDNATVSGISITNGSTFNCSNAYSFTTSSLTNLITGGFLIINGRSTANIGSISATATGNTDGVSPTFFSTLTYCVQVMNGSVLNVSASAAGGDGTVTLNYHNNNQSDSTDITRMNVCVLDGSYFACRTLTIIEGILMTGGSAAFNSLCGIIASNNSNVIIQYNIVLDVPQSTSSSIYGAVSSWNCSDLFVGYNPSSTSTYSIAFSNGLTAKSITKGALAFNSSRLTILNGVYLNVNRAISTAAFNRAVGAEADSIVYLGTLAALGTGLTGVNPTVTVASAVNTTGRIYITNNSYATVYGGITGGSGGVTLNPFVYALNGSTIYHDMLGQTMSTDTGNLVTYLWQSNNGSNIVVNNSTGTFTLSVTLTTLTAYAASINNSRITFVCACVFSPTVSTSSVANAGLIKAYYNSTISFTSTLTSSYTVSNGSSTSSRILVETIDNSNVIFADVTSLTLLGTGAGTKTNTVVYNEASNIVFSSTSTIIQGNATGTATCTMINTTGGGNTVFVGAPTISYGNSGGTVTLGGTNSINCITVSGRGNIIFLAASTITCGYTSNNITGNIGCSYITGTSGGNIIAASNLTFDGAVRHNSLSSGSSTYNRYLVDMTNNSTMRIAGNYTNSNTNYVGSNTTFPVFCMNRIQNNAEIYVSGTSTSSFTIGSDTSANWSITTFYTFILTTGGAFVSVGNCTFDLTDSTVGTATIAHFVGGDIVNSTLRGILKTYGNFSSTVTSANTTSFTDTINNCLNLASDSSVGISGTFGCTMSSANILVTGYTYLASNSSIQVGGVSTVAVVTSNTANGAGFISLTNGAEMNFTGTMGLTITYLDKGTGGVTSNGILITDASRLTGAVGTGSADAIKMTINEAATTEAVTFNGLVMRRNAFMNVGFTGSEAIYYALNITKVGTTNTAFSLNPVIISSSSTLNLYGMFNCITATGVSGIYIFNVGIESIVNIGGNIATTLTSGCAPGLLTLGDMSVMNVYGTIGYSGAASTSIGAIPLILINNGSLLTTSGNATISYYNTTAFSLHGVRVDNFSKMCLYGGTNSITRNGIAAGAGGQIIYGLYSGNDSEVFCTSLTSNITYTDVANAVTAYPIYVTNSGQLYTGGTLAPQLTGTATGTTGIIGAGIFINNGGVCQINSNCTITLSGQSILSTGGSIGSLLISDGATFMCTGTFLQILSSSAQANYMCDVDTGAYVKCVAMTSGTLTNSATTFGLRIRNGSKVVASGTTTLASDGTTAGSYGIHLNVKGIASLAGFATTAFDYGIYLAGISECVSSTASSCGGFGTYGVGVNQMSSFCCQGALTGTGAGASTAGVIILQGSKALVLNTGSTLRGNAAGSQIVVGVRAVTLYDSVLAGTDNSEVSTDIVGVGYGVASSHDAIGLSF